MKIETPNITLHSLKTPQLVKSGYVTHPHCEKWSELCSSRTLWAKGKYRLALQKESSGLRRGLPEHYAAAQWPCDTCARLNRSPLQRFAAGKQSSQVQSSGAGATLLLCNESPNSGWDIDCFNPSPLTGTTKWILMRPPLVFNNQKKKNLKVSEKVM